MDFITNSPFNLARCYYMVFKDNKKALRYVYAVVGNISIRSDLNTRKVTMKFNVTFPPHQFERITYERYEQLLVKHNIIK